MAARWTTTRETDFQIPKEKVGMRFEPAPRMAECWKVSEYGAQSARCTS